jgi:hypothetical protein
MEKGANNKERLFGLINKKSFRIYDSGKLADKGGLIIKRSYLG